MFERYSPAARELVPLACREAAARGADVVAPEHLLLALGAVEGSARVLADLGLGPWDVREALDDEEAAALARLGISLHDVREHVEASFGAGVWAAPPLRRPKLKLATSTKQVLKLAPREAAALGHRRVRPEHVLLALTCPNGRTRSLLIGLGVAPQELRERALDELATPERC